MINFIRAMLAFQDLAAREELTANEVVLWMAIFRCHNDAYWPEGALAISNNQLLARTTFCGSKRDDTLRETRRRLAERGLITFTPGEAYKARPTYAICWEALGIAPEDSPEDALEDAPQDTPEDAPKKRGEMGGYNQNININKNPAHGPGNMGEAHTTRPRAGGYADPEGLLRPCRYDLGWLTSGKARAAVAQRLVDRLGPEAGADMHDFFWRLMELGMPPELIEDAAGQGLNPVRLRARLRRLAEERGYTEEAAERRRWAMAAEGAGPGLRRALEAMQ